MKPIALLLALVTSTALAESHTLTWDLPTQDTNNVALPAGAIAQSRVQCGLGPTSPVPWIVDATVQAPATSFTFDFATNGQWNCHVWVVCPTCSQTLSDDTPDLVFTIPFVVPVVTHGQPKAATNLRVK